MLLVLLRLLRRLVRVVVAVAALSASLTVKSSEYSLERRRSLYPLPRRDLQVEGAPSNPEREISTQFP